MQNYKPLFDSGNLKNRDAHKAERTLNSGDTRQTNFSMLVFCSVDKYLIYECILMESFERPSIPRRL